MSVHGDARGMHLNLLILGSGPARGRSDRPPCYLRCYCVQGTRSFGHSPEGHGRLLLPSRVPSILPVTLEPTGVSIQKTPARCRQARVAHPARQSFAIQHNRLCQNCADRSCVSTMSADVCRRQQDTGEGERLLSRPLVLGAHTQRRASGYYRLPRCRQESEAILAPFGRAVSSRPWVSLRQGCDFMNHPKVPQRGEFTRKPPSSSAHLCPSVAITALRFRGHLNSPGAPAS